MNPSSLPWCWFWGASTFLLWQNISLHACFHPQLLWALSFLSLASVQGLAQPKVTAHMPLLPHQWKYFSQSCDSVVTEGMNVQLHSPMAAAGEMRLCPWVSRSPLLTRLLFGYTFPDTFCGFKITREFLLVGSSRFNQCKQMYQGTEFLCSGISYPESSGKEGLGEGGKFLNL